MNWKAFPVDLITPGRQQPTRPNGTGLGRHKNGRRHEHSHWGDGTREDQGSTKQYATVRSTAVDHGVPAVSAVDSADRRVRDLPGVLRNLPQHAEQEDDRL